MVSRKVAFITGASRGIGKAIALELARNNIDIIINFSKDDKEANLVVDEIKKLGVESFAIKADVSNFDECQSTIKIITKKFGYIDILVNNAGAIIDKTLKNMTKEQWDKVLRINLDGTFNVTKNALPYIKDGGRIISISSVVGLNGNFGQTNYAASKAGIIGFTKSLAKELGKRRITVNAIAPGFIETVMTKNVPFIRKRIMKAMTPLGRIGKPEDIANAAAFLASEKSSYITGEVLRVDGGLNF
jgi:3-oxoacyl-[acyl-carrier protein] reductase